MGTVRSSRGDSDTAPKPDERGPLYFPPAFHGIGDLIRMADLFLCATQVEETNSQLWHCSGALNFHF